MTTHSNRSTKRGLTLHLTSDDEQGPSTKISRETSSYPASTLQSVPLNGTSTGGIPLDATDAGSFSSNSSISLLPPLSSQAGSLVPKAAAESSQQLSEGEHIVHLWAQPLVSIAGPVKQHPPENSQQHCLIVWGAEDCLVFPHEPTTESGTSLIQVYCQRTFDSEYIVATQDGRHFTLISPGHRAEDSKELAIFPVDGSRAVGCFAVVKWLMFNFDGDEDLRSHFKSVLPEDHFFFKGLDHTTPDTSRYSLEKLCQKLHAQVRQAEEAVKGDSEHLGSHPPSLNSADSTAIDTLYDDCTSLPTTTSKISEEGVEETRAVVEVVENGTVAIEVSARAHGEVWQMRISFEKTKSDSEAAQDLENALGEPFTIDFTKEWDKDDFKTWLRDAEDLWDHYQFEDKEEVLCTLVGHCEDRQKELENVLKKSRSGKSG